LKYVYLIQSISNPDQKYVGTTSDVDGRISAHNAGQSPHTSKYKPWKLAIYVAFSNTEKATEFEKYLKTGSGRAFANRHFCS
jgi:putative endonuclease